MIGVGRNAFVKDRRPIIMKTALRIAALSILAAFAGCDNRDNLKTALTTVEIGIATARSSIAIAVATGSLASSDGQSATQVLDELDTATQKSIVEANSSDDDSTCFTKVAGYYTTAILMLPQLPANATAILQIVVDYVNTVLAIAGKPPIVLSAELRPAQTFTLAANDISTLVLL